jgi:hypothetical protein
VEITEAGCPKGAVVKIVIPYWAYDFKKLPVVISTSQGALLVSLDPGAPVSEEQRKNDALLAKLERINRCYVRGHLLKDVRWLIDPPDLIVSRTKRLWGIAGAVSKNTQRLEVETDSGRPLLNIDSSRQKTFRVLVASQEQGIRIRQQLSHEWTDENPDTGEIHLVQILAAIDDELRFDEPIQALDIFHARDGRRLIIHGPSTTRVFAFAPTGNAMLVSELDVTDQPLGRTAGRSADVAPARWRFAHPGPGIRVSLAAARRCFVERSYGTRNR